MRQKNPKLLKDIQEVGCLFLCLSKMSEDLYQYQYEPEQLNSVWEIAVKKSYIVNRETKSPDGVLKLLKQIANVSSDKNIIQIGQTLNGVTQYWGWVQDKHKKNIQTMAMEKIGGSIGTHFVLVKSLDDPVIIYDSWNLARIGERSNAQRFIYYAVI